MAMGMFMDCGPRDSKKWLKPMAWLLIRGGMRIGAHGTRMQGVMRNRAFYRVMPRGASHSRFRIFYQAPYMWDTRVFGFSEARMPHPPR